MASVWVGAVRKEQGLEAASTWCCCLQALQGAGFSAQHHYRNEKGLSLRPSLLVTYLDHPMNNGDLLSIYVEDYNLPCSQA
jgi:hypothetical protein